MDPVWAKEFLVESWAFCAVTILVVAGRLTLRATKLGFRNLQLDDFWMIPIAGVFVGYTVVLNRLVVEEDLPAESDPELDYKLRLVAQQAILEILYSNKACLLILYYRLMTALRTEFRKALCASTIYIFSSWALSQIAFWSMCKHEGGLWHYASSFNCYVARDYNIFHLVLNVSSDIVLLALFVPKLIHTSLPTRTKWSLVGLYSLGVYTIIAAVLTRVYIFSDGLSIKHFSWCVRELAASTILANLPVIWPLIHRKISKDKEADLSDYSSA